ncbi:hypothetical protein ACWT_1855 [Actinoplanes sp. SE50]|nr:hypothetical protein ACWT_1855 [Actinoplanes sp. SE50]
MAGSGTAASGAAGTGAAKSGAAGSAAGTPAAATEAACGIGKFAATSEADLAKITVLDPGPLAPDLPALADVRLAPATGEVVAGNHTGRSDATASYADAKLLGMHLPGLPLHDAVAAQHAPGGPRGPVDVTLATLNAGGLATARLGTATAAATWTDGYHCGRTGPLTRATTMVQGLSLLGGAGGVPAIQAVDALTHLTRRTSLLTVGPTGSTRSATALVKLGGGRIGVRSGAGVALGDVILFSGTPQEITAKVINQPTLEVVAGGDRKHSTVTYQPATLAVTSAGKPVPGLTGDQTSVSLNLLGRLAADRPASPLSVRISVGKVTRHLSDTVVRAEAASLRVEVKLGSAHLLDVALGYLTVAATAPCRIGAPVPRDRVPATGQPGDTPGDTQQTTPATQVVATTTPQPGTPGSGSGALALTGSNVAAVGLGGLALIAGGLTALFFTRRRYTAKH